MSAALKFPSQRANSQIEKRDEREEAQKYARAIVERYVRRERELVAHARRLGEIALELQEKEERANQSKAQKIHPSSEQKFRRLADEWRKDTKHTSSVDEMVLHPNYLKIIAMGEEAIPLLLRELEQRPDHWLVALNILTDKDPSSPEDTFNEAVQSWIAWGKQAGHIS
jgi:hypothetical protein